MRKPIAAALLLSGAFLAGAAPGAFAAEPPPAAVLTLTDTSGPQSARGELFFVPNASYTSAFVTHVFCIPRCHISRHKISE